MIKRVLALLFLILLQLSAKQYDSNIIDIEAKLFVKIALLESSIQKSDNTLLRIYIVAKQIDNSAAMQFKNAIQADYPDMLLNKKIVVKAVHFQDAVKQKPDAIIVLEHTEQKLREIAKWANENKIVSFAYDPAYLEYGVLVSLYFGKTTQPYLNKKIIQEYGFVFDPYLIQLSKFKE
ncbi:MAG: hypothetical protein FAF04_01705 [Epsilonproteobacteria bacterium]|nr:hypothetical protein [Campylobacterota bacterium]